MSVCPRVLVGFGRGRCYLVIKSGLLVYMVTYPCLITDFDRKLLVNVAVNVPGLAPRVGFGWGLHGFWRCRVRPRGLAAFGGDASQSQKWGPVLFF